MDLISILISALLVCGIAAGFIFSAQSKGVKKCQQLVSLRKAERMK